MVCVFFWMYITHRWKSLLFKNAIVEMPCAPEWEVRNAVRGRGGVMPKRGRDAQKETLAILQGPHWAFLQRKESGWWRKRPTGQAHQSWSGEQAALEFPACHVKKALQTPQSARCLVSVLVNFMCQPDYVMMLSFLVKRSSRCYWKDIFFRCD